MNESVNERLVPSHVRSSFITSTCTTKADAPTVKNRTNLTCVCLSLSLAFNIRSKE